MEIENEKKNGVLMNKKSLLLCYVNDVVCINILCMDLMAASKDCVSIIIMFICRTCKQYFFFFHSRCRHHHHTFLNFLSFACNLFIASFQFGVYNFNVRTFFPQME